MDDQDEVRARLRGHQAPASITPLQQAEAELHVAEKYHDVIRLLKDSTDALYRDAQARLLGASTAYAEVAGLPLAAVRAQPGDIVTDEAGVRGVVTAVGVNAADITFSSSWPRGTTSGMVAFECLEPDGHRAWKITR